VTTLTAGERACNLDRLAEATREATLDEMEVALEYAIDTLTDTCPAVTSITMSDSDQGDCLCIDDVTCGTHARAQCPAQALVESEPYAEYGYHLYASPVNWLVETYGLVLAHRHSAGWYALDIVTYRARHLEHSTGE